MVLFRIEFNIKRSDIFRCVINIRYVLVYMLNMILFLKVSMKDDHFPVGRTIQRTQVFQLEVTNEENMIDKAQR